MVPTISQQEHLTTASGPHLQRLTAASFPVVTVYCLKAVIFL